MRRRVFALTALAWLGAAACVTPGMQRKETFTRLAREFNDDVRWGRYASAAQSFPPDEARLFLERVKLAGPDLEIADQDVTSIQFASDEAATVVVKFDWFSKREMLVKSTTIEESWKYLDGRWRVVSQKRVGGDRFPLVPERKD